jgi:hypothetical protein
MTILDAIKAWVESHKLTVIHYFSYGPDSMFGPWPTTIWMDLSNNMHIDIDGESYITITGSLSKISYKAHISDPHLFPILDRALDEEDKWIRDGHRAPE